MLRAGSASEDKYLTAGKMTNTRQPINQSRTVVARADGDKREDPIDIWCQQVARMGAEIFTTRPHGCDQEGLFRRKCLIPLQDNDLQRSIFYINCTKMQGLHSFYCSVSADMRPLGPEQECRCVKPAASFSETTPRKGLRPPVVMGTTPEHEDLAFR